MEKEVEPQFTTKMTAVEEPPDGGYGWVIVICVFMSNGMWPVLISFKLC